MTVSMHLYLQIMANKPHSREEAGEDQLQWKGKEHHQHGYEASWSHIDVKEVHEHYKNQGTDPQLMDEQKCLYGNKHV